MFPKSGEPFCWRVALWLWIGPLLLIAISFLNSLKLGVLSIVAMLWLAIAQIVRLRQVEQGELIESRALSTDERDELIRAGVPSEVIAKVHIREKEELDATEFNGRITFSQDFWNILSPIERLAVVERMNKPQTAVRVSACVLALAVVCAVSFSAESWVRNDVFARYDRENAQMYADLLFRIPTIALASWSCNKVSKQIMFFGDLTVWRSGGSDDALVTALEKCAANKTRDERISRLCSAQSPQVSG